MHSFNIAGEGDKTREDWRIESMEGSWVMFLILWQIQIIESMKQGSNIVR